MPLRINVGLSKKVGLPDYGSLGASCHVEYEADSSQLNGDLEAFQRQVKNAYIATDQAFQSNGTVPAAGRNGAGLQRNNGSVSPQSNGQRRTNGRKATASQMRALEAIGNRLQLNINEWLQEKYGIRIAAEMSIADASAAIDELNSTPSNGEHN
jgi:hypothetical protein